MVTKGIFGATVDYNEPNTAISVDAILSANNIDKESIVPIGGIVAHTGIYRISRRTDEENGNYYQIVRCDKVCGCGVDHRHIADIPEDVVNIYDLRGSHKFPTALAIALYKNQII